MAKKILMVEDDSVSRESLTKLLTQSGYEVCAVWSAEEAKRVLATFTPDVALLDIRLPGIPGDALGIYLQNKFPGTRIIFMSGNFSEETSSRFGPSILTMAKPLNLEKLLEELKG